MERVYDQNYWIGVTSKPLHVRNLFQSQIDFLKDIIYKKPEIYLSLKAYKSDLFENINNSIRYNDIINDDIKNIINNIDYIFKNIPPLEKDIILYRGINDPTYINQNSYISTSLTLNGALNFKYNNCCILKIHIPSGTKIIPLHGIFKDSDFGQLDEKEVLLQPNSKLEIFYEYIDKMGVKTFECIYIK